MIQTGVLIGHILIGRRDEIHEWYMFGQQEMH